MGNGQSESPPVEEPIITRDIESNYSKLLRNTTLTKGALTKDAVGCCKTYLEKIHKEAEEKGDYLQVKEFPQYQEWFNCQPLRWDKELKGKLVVLDFWTYCCINCLHILPRIAFLEKKYSGQPVVFIGVHSAKFEAEKTAFGILNAILKYDIHHPVVNDKNQEMWVHVGVNAWPSMCLISPQGKLLWSGSGENCINTLEPLVDAALSVFEGQFSGHQIASALEKDSFQKGIFQFPGKIALDSINNRLFVCDSGNHRVVILTLDSQQSDEKLGIVHAVIGSGVSGNKDGSFNETQFHSPQGLAYCPVRDVLYVADTKNHCLKEVNLKESRVVTLAGVGTQGSDYKAGKVGTEQPLSSPWDVAVSTDGAYVFISMAGQHQIWKYEVETKKNEVVSGSGAESAENKETLLTSCWAQPSGISLSSNNILFVADAESSRIRGVDFNVSKTFSYCGGSKVEDDLKVFGDVDGKGVDARLQHPVGVLALSTPINGSDVIFADTFNNKIKLLDSKTGQTSLWAGSGKGGDQLGSLKSSEFNEPNSIAFDATNQIVFISDTNNHKIKWVHVPSGLVKELKIGKKVEDGPSPAETESKTQTGQLELALSADNGKITFKLGLPASCHLNEEAPSKFSLEAIGATFSPSSDRLSSTSVTTAFKVQSWEKFLAPGSLVFKATIYYCSDEDGTCGMGNVNKQLEVKRAGATASCSLEIVIPV